MIDPYIGQIILFSGDFPPKGWAFCNGAILNVAANTPLFSIIGNRYGGNGITTFALPDLRGCTVIHPTYQFGLAAKSGSVNKEIRSEHIPAHTHKVTTKIKAKSTAGNSKTPVNCYPANTGAADKQYASTANDNMAANMLTATVTNDGGNAGVTNMQPYQTVNFIIALQGEFPSRP